MPPHLTSALDLLDLPPGEAAAFFAGERPERIVALVDDLDDKQLARLVGDTALRSTAISHVLDRLEEFSLPGPLAEVKGVVEFVVDVPKGRPERHALRFDGAGVEPVLGSSPDPDVSVHLGALEFVRLVSGGVNAAILLLGGRLRIEGDELLALRVGGVFQVPGRPGVAVDPGAVDPEEAAAAIKGVKDAHLEKVMSGGFREVVLDQVFSRLPDFLDADKAAGLSLAVGFRVDGRPDGGADRATVVVESGRARVERDGDRVRDATLLLGGPQFLKLVLGHLNPVTAVVRGSLKVKGDVSKALTLHRVMRIPGS